MAVIEGKLREDLVHMWWLGRLPCCFYHVLHLCFTLVGLAEVHHFPLKRKYKDFTSSNVATDG